jgi:hypothetical protein
MVILVAARLVNLYTLAPIVAFGSVTLMRTFSTSVPSFHPGGIISDPKKSFSEAPKFWSDARGWVPLQAYAWVLVSCPRSK